MKSRVKPWATTDGRDAMTVRSEDGVLAISIRSAADGVFVERTVQRSGSSRVVQAVVFASASQFRRWCDADALRFEYPLVARSLIRHADELFNSRALADIAG